MIYTSKILQRKYNNGYRAFLQCDTLVDEGAKRGRSPAQVVQTCEITFGMLSDPAAALAVVEGEEGVASATDASHAYVDMSTVDASTSQRIAGLITAKGGRFVEVRSSSLSLYCDMLIFRIFRSATDS